MKSGIYKIKNLITKDCYIGSAKNIKDRWKRHKKDLRKNKHHSIYLQRAYNKYQENNFIYGVIEFCDINELEYRENYFFDIYKPKYNICPTAYSQIGRKLTEEHINKLKIFGAKNQKAKDLLRDYSKKFQKKITLLDYNTLEPKIIFESITEACNYIGKSNKFCSTISSCCTGKRKSAYGYKWRFSNEEDLKLIKKSINII